MQTNIIRIIALIGLTIVLIMSLFKLFEMGNFIFEANPNIIKSKKLKYPEIVGWGIVPSFALVASSCIIAIANLLKK